VEKGNREKMNLKIIIGQMRWYIMQLNKKPNTKRYLGGKFVIIIFIRTITTNMYIG
jgi:hypothetical protein